MIARVSAWGMWLCLLAAAAPAAAQGALVLTRASPGQIRVDGDAGEWRNIRWQELGEGDDASIQHALAYDAEALYFAARVWDDALVRTRSPGSREDAIVLTLALPTSSGTLRPSEVWLYAGIVGEQASVAAVGAPGAGERTKAIEIVEGPLGSGRGYFVEARVPWKTLPGGRDWMLGRGALRLIDADEPGRPPKGELATARFDAKQPLALPPLLAEGGPNATLADFLRSKSVASTRRDLLGDVTGDARLERVAVAGTFAVVVGPDIDEGRGFHFVDLPVTTSAGVREAELRDLTGDGKQELLVTLRQTNDLGNRDVLYVMDLVTPPAKPIFGIELRKEAQGGVVEAAFEVGRGARPTLEARIGRAQGIDADTYGERPATGVEAILLPWGEVKRRVYRWDGARFAVEEEEPNDARARRAKEPAKARATSAPSGPDRIVSHPEPPSADDLVAAFREAQGVPAFVRPRFQTHVDLAEDRRHETLMLLGTHLLVIGEGFLSGTGWYWFGLPVQEPDAVQRVFTADVTGDGRREVFVRFQQVIGDVEREILLGYTFAGGSLRRILGVEVRRARAGQSVGNVVKVVPAGKHWALRIFPGGATGWDVRTYPFVSEQTDEWEPVRLPWVHRPASYRYDGTALAATR